MAEPVIVPVQAKLVDVDTSQLNFADVSKEISKSMSGIKKSIEDAFKGIDPSAINKPIEQAMTSVRKSVQAAEDAQLRYNEALIRAGKSSKEYKSAVKEADSQIAGQQEIVNQLTNMGVNEKLIAPYRKQLEDLIEARNKINPVDFVDSAEPIQLEKVANAYRKVLSAQETVSKQSENFNKVAHDNRFSDEYVKMAKEAEGYGNKLRALDDKFKSMERYGATSKQWQKARDQADEYSRKLDEVITKMRAAVGDNSAFRFGSGDKGEANAQINNLASASGGDVGKQRTIGNITRVASAIKAGFGKAMSVIGRVSSGIVGCVKNMNLFGKSGRSTSTDLQSRFKKLGKNILMFGLGFRTAYFAVKRLRNIFIEGFKLMGDEFDEFGEPMKRMIESFNRLKGSLATAFQPLASIVMPILTKAMNYLSGMLEAIGKFNAALTGQGYIYKAIAKNVNSVASAAKNANNQLASYDKLEVIQDNNLGYDYEKQTLGETDRAVSDFATMVKEAWEKSDFKGVGEYVTNQLLNVLDNVEKNIIPKVTGFINKLLISINTFFDGFNSGAIGKSIGSIFNTLVDGLKFDEIGKLFANFINVVSEFLEGLVNKIDWVLLGESLATGIITMFNNINFKSFIGLLGGFITGVIDTLQTVFKSVGESLEGSNNPLASILGTLILAVSDVIDILDSWVQWIIEKGPEFYELIGLLWNILEPITDTAWGIFKSVLEGLTSLLQNLFGWILDNKEAVVAALVGIVSALLAYKTVLAISSLIKLFTDGMTLATLAAQAMAIAQAALNVVMNMNPIGLVVAAIVGLVAAFVVLWNNCEGFRNFWINLWEVVKNSAINAWKALKPVLNTILGALESFVNGAIKGINSMIKSLNNLSFDVPDWVPNIGGKKFGFNLSEVRQIKIPRLAQGAVIPPNKEFLAMLGDQKHGTNIEAPLNTIKQALAEVLAEVGGGTREPIVLQVNGRTLAKVVWDEQEKRYKQTGKYSPA